jgi:hypothetical protein
MKRILFGWIGLLLLAGMALSAHVEADPGKEYPINKEAGPWLICVASFTAPQGADFREQAEAVRGLARELTLVIRRDYQLPAYVFDKGKEERRKQQEEFEKMRQMNPEGRNIRGVRIMEEYAVLVGGYKDRDSARKALDAIKRLPPPPKKFCDFGFVQQRVTRDSAKDADTRPFLYNPFHTSFVVHNPTVPLEQEDPAKDLKLLEKLNEGESLSLLSCKKPWTLVVKEFHCISVIQSPQPSSKIADFFGMGDMRRDHLTAAALNAEEFAKVLRTMKPVSFEAYVLHTRTSSLVTVGGYDSLNDPKMEKDKQLLSKITLQAQDPRVPSANTQFLMQPMPMQEPGRDATR